MTGYLGNIPKDRFSEEFGENHRFPGIWGIPKVSKIPVGIRG